MVFPISCFATVATTDETAEHKIKCKHPLIDLKYLPEVFDLHVGLVLLFDVET